MTSYSVLYPHQPRVPSELAGFAELVAESAFVRLWTGQSFFIESHMALASLAGTPHAVPVGIATALVPLRTPYDAALQARSLAFVLGQPVTVAYGASDPQFTTSLTGRPYERPASHVAEYARIVRQLLDGATVSSDVERLETMRAFLPPGPPVSVEVGTGVLRAGMARRSRTADVVVSWLTPRGYVRDVLLPELGPEPPRVVTNVHVAVDREGRNPYLLAQMACQNHLGKLHYVDMLRRAGLDLHPGDTASGARELVRRKVFVVGSPGEIAAELRDIGRHGIDEIVLNTTGVAMLHGDEEALHDLRDISDAVRRDTDGS